MERMGICVVSPSPDKILHLSNDLAANPIWGVEVVFSTCDGDTLLGNLHRFPQTCTLVDATLGPESVEYLVIKLLRAGYQAIILWGQVGEDLTRQCEVVAATAPVSSIVAAVHRLNGLHYGQPQAAEASEGRRRPVIITVHSPKGGSGKTLLTCALAVQYTAKGLRAIVIDLAQYGGVAPALGLMRKDKGLGRVLESGLGQPGSCAGVLLDNLVSFPVGDMQLDILPSAAPLKMAAMQLEQADALLGAVVHLPYDVVLVDTSSEIAERTVVAMKAADVVLLVITPELPAAWALLSMKDMLHNLNTDGNLQIVLNRSQPGTSTRELEGALGYPVVAQIPEAAKPWENAVGKSLAFNYSPFGLALKHLAQRYAQVFSPAEIPSLKK